MSMQMLSAALTDRSGSAAIGERVKFTTVQIQMTAMLMVALTAAVAWYHSNGELHQTRAQIVRGELQPIAVLLQEDQSLIRQLQAGQFTEKGVGILESYIAKIRRDGVAKNAAMKQRLDELAENNTAIITLIKAYAPHARTQAFVTESDKFRNYASAWRDRWNSVMELYMAGGNYAVAGVPFPSGFSEAVQSEIRAAK